MFSTKFDELVQRLRVLPGVGPKSAQRMALHLLSRNRQGGHALALALEAGGVRCRSCGGGRPVTDQALSVCRAVLGGGLNAVLDLPEGAVTHEVDSVATTALELHIERRLRSLKVLHDA